MGILNWITQGCDALTATVAPSVDALGIHICIALATIMLVWFGVQESLASAHGGPGFSMAKFLNFFMLITFAYVMVRFYDSAMPGVGYSLRGFINGGAQYLVTVIGNDSLTAILSTLDKAQSTSGPGVVKALMNPYYAIVYVLIQVILAIFSAVVSVIVAYGAIASAVVGLLGPIFIPFLVFEKLDFLFWGLHWFLLLQGFGSGSSQHYGQSSGALLHRYRGLLGPGTDGETAPLTDHSRAGKCLHPAQDTSPDNEHLLWLDRRSRRRLGLGNCPSAKGMI
jgi:hypothetical protein